MNLMRLPALCTFHLNGGCLFGAHQADDGLKADAVPGLDIGHAGLKVCVHLHHCPAALYRHLIKHQPPRHIAVPFLLTAVLGRDKEAVMMLWTLVESSEYS